MIQLLVFIIGIFIGSFLNVCIFRIPEGKSIVNPPSACGSCGHRLNYIDMIPVFNYFIFRGRCRYCKAKFSIQYPLIELANGILYVLIFTVHGATVQSIFFSILGSLLIVISIIDLKYLIIPDSLQIFGIVIAIAYIIAAKENILYSAAGSIIGLFVFLLIAILTNAMGGGDIKLMAVLGLFFQIKGIAFVGLVSFVLGAIVSVFLLALKIKSRKDMVPFGPFISLAALLYILCGQQIIDFYLSLF